MSNGNAPASATSAAASPADAKDIAEYQTIIAVHARLKANVIYLEQKCSRQMDPSADAIIAELESEITTICGADVLTTSGSWLDPEIKMDGIHGLRAVVAEKRHMIVRLSGAEAEVALEAAKQELAEFEKVYALLLGLKPGNGGKTATPPAAPIDNHMTFTPVFGTALADAEREGFDGAGSVYAGPPLNQEMRRGLHEAGFRAACSTCGGTGDVSDYPAAYPIGCPDCRPEPSAEKVPPAAPVKEPAPKKGPKTYRGWAKIVKEPSDPLKPKAAKARIDAWLAAASDPERRRIGLELVAAGWKFVAGSLEAAREEQDEIPFRVLAELGFEKDAKFLPTLSPTGICWDASGYAAWITDWRDAVEQKNTLRLKELEREIREDEGWKRKAPAEVLAVGPGGVS